MDLRIIAPALPSGYCWPASPQTFANDFADAAVAQFPDTIQGVIISDAEPAVSDRDKLWIRTSGGAPVTPLGWVFFNGQWVAKHPEPPSSSKIILYEGTSGSIDTLDGGAAGAVSVNSGPFWEIVTSMAQRVPVGVGTLPDSGTILGVGDTGGTDQHTNTESEMFKHTHRINAYGTNDPSNGHGVIGGANGTTGPFTYDETTFPGDNLSIESKGSTTPYSIMNPYRAVYFLRRTARVYCTQPMA